MKIQGKHYRSLWLDQDGETLCIIDQRVLPHRFEVARLRDLAEPSAPSARWRFAAHR